MMCTSFRRQHFLLYLFFFMAPMAAAPAAAIMAGQDELKGYIVHMEKTQMPSEFDHHLNWYDSSLKTVSPTAEAYYTFDSLVNGFSVSLTAAQAKAMTLRPGVLAVLPEIRYQLHTTRTPNFLRLSRSAQFSTQTDSLSDIVVGVLDTGVWPESRSFSDEGMPPVPSSWKGACLNGTHFTPAMCNRKLVGAKYFFKGYEAALGPVDVNKESLSCRDDDGHGTHTASTAAGSSVSGANLLGYANGVARGMAMHARVASYKVCWLGGCFNSDILAAMEAAVNDGVHVISMSLGGGMSDYYKDSVAMGAFAAMEKGVLVTCSAGNAGPSPSSLSNVAPWITTVGAGTLDRDFPAVVTLGNGLNVTGVSLYRGDPLPKSPLPIIYAGSATNVSNGNLCLANTLNSNSTFGKIVLCDRGINPRVQKGFEVKAARGAGMLLGNTAANGEELVADAHMLPAAALGQKAAILVKKYIQSARNPTATIVFQGTLLGVKPSPVVAAFSSRGPNPITPTILKPDLIAPGVNILAGWTGAVGPSGLPVDSRKVAYNIISGTSMSCPHVAGLAALLKGVHPDWSPAALRSALMTTAYTAYPDRKPILDTATAKPATALDFGSGHVDPVAALNPGLVYDLKAGDYFGFLCALNYTREGLLLVTKRNHLECSRRTTVGDLNYPSFSVEFQSGQGEGKKSYRRKVTSVGGAGRYRVRIWSGTKDVKMRVEPGVLNFKRAGEVKGYVVSFTGRDLPSGSKGFGKVEWVDGVHSVKSPVVFTWV